MDYSWSFGRQKFPVITPENTLDSANDLRNSPPTTRPEIIRVPQEKIIVYTSLSIPGKNVPSTLINWVKLEEEFLIWGKSSNSTAQGKNLQRVITDGIFFETRVELNNIRAEEIDFNRDWHLNRLWTALEDFRSINCE